MLRLARSIFLACVGVTLSCGGRSVDSEDAGQPGGAGATGGATTGTGGSTTGTGGAAATGGSTTGTGGATTGTGGAATTGTGGGTTGSGGATTGAGGATTGTGGATTGTGGTTGGSGGGTGGSSIDAGDCGCVSDSLRWGRNGGELVYMDTSGLETCRTFLYQRAPRSSTQPILSCKQEITACANFNAGLVSRALANSDVRAAIMAAPVVYGEDTRPTDGQVFRIVVNGAIIDVGNDCTTMSCKPIPSGVAALEKLLSGVTNQELGINPCKDTFPSLPP